MKLLKDLIEMDDDQLPLDIEDDRTENMEQHSAEDVVCSVLDDLCNNGQYDLSELKDAVQTWLCSVHDQQTDDDISIDDSDMQDNFDDVPHDKDIDL